MEIGEKTYFKGIQIIITTIPYELYGGWWQDGVDATGKTFSVATPAQRSLNAEKAKAEREVQQAGFARLAALKRSE